MDLPVHPMLVHLPLVLAVALPPLFGVLLWTGSRGQTPGMWRIAVGLALVLALSASAAVYSGEQDEEIVESVVSEAALETHEDRADVFLWLSWLVAGITAAGLLQGAMGRSARLAAVGFSALLLVAAVGTGHAGAELVYRHGAAQVHTMTTGPGTSHSAAQVDDDD